MQCTKLRKHRIVVASVKVSARISLKSRQFTLKKGQACRTLQEHSVHVHGHHQIIKLGNLQSLLLSQSNVNLVSGGLEFETHFLGNTVLNLPESHSNLTSPINGQEKLVGFIAPKNIVFTNVLGGHQVQLVGEAVHCPILVLFSHFPRFHGTKFSLACQVDCLHFEREEMLSPKNFWKNEKNFSIPLLKYPRLPSD